MDKAFYRQEILEAYSGEIIGQAAFDALAANDGLNAEQRHCMSRLAELERVTRERLESVMRRHGLSVANADQIAVQTRDAVGQNRAEWAPTLQSVGDGVKPYIPRFEALCASAEAEDAEALKRLLEHELALAAFAKEELDGNSAKALDIIETAIR